MQIDEKANDMRLQRSEAVAGKGKFSYLILNFGGGIFYFWGSLLSVLDFIIVQHAIYHFGFVNLVGFAFVVAGLGVRLQATRTLGKYFSPTVRVLPEHQLIKHGIYKHVRHPIYLGSLLAFFSIPLIFHSLYGFLVTTIAIPFILYKIRVEEQMFTEKFGDEYRDYIKKSKKLIPYVY